MARLLKFMLVGGSGALLKLAIMYAMVDMLGWHYLASYPVSFAVVVTSNYIFNNCWTFADKRAGLRGYGRYMATSLCTLMLNEAIVYVLTGLLGWHYLISTSAAILVSFALNFTFSRRFVWRTANS